MKRSLICGAIIAFTAAGLATTGGIVFAQARPAAPRSMLSQGAILPGAWQIATKYGAPRTLCLSDILPLIQISHPGASCGRLVIEDTPGNATVHYSCPGAGWGRTSVHMVTTRSIEIETQGIAGKEPFAFEAQARHLGACGATVKSIRR